MELVSRHTKMCNTKHFRHTSAGPDAAGAGAFKGTLLPPLSPPPFRCGDDALALLLLLPPVFPSTPLPPSRCPLPTIRRCSTCCPPRAPLPPPLPSSLRMLCMYVHVWIYYSM